VRGGQAIAPDLFQQAARRWTSDVCGLYRDRNRARVADGRGGWTLDAPAFLGATQHRLRVGDDVREASRDRAQVNALRLPGVEARLIEGIVRHCCVVDGVAHLPAGHVLE